MPKRSLLFLALVFLSIAEFILADDGFTFHGFRNAAADVALDGAARIERGGILELTNFTASLVGHAFYETPFRFKNGNSSSSFSTSFAFAIVPEYEKLGGHGFAFAVSKSKGLTGGFPREFLGLLNESNFGNFSNHVFAVEFDTVRDYSFGDIDDNHVGIDINSLISNASVAASYFAGDGSPKELNLKTGKLIQAWIDYDSVRKEVNVTLSPSSRKPKSPILSVNIDLSSILTEYMYVGFSSSTGLLASSHYISGWSFQMNGQAQPLDLSLCPSVPHRKQNRLPLALGTSFFSAGFCLLGIGISFYIIKKIKNRDVFEPWEIHVGPHRYSYKELKKATRGFSNKELLGFGGSGRVYKGTMPDSNTHVAVKRIISHESKQGLREFVTEIESIGRLRHRNLVPLQGWCRKRTDLLLVYEFMPNGSLDKYVFDNPKIILSWEQRLKIIKGVASGLLYLHEEWEKTVIHRDVKAGNVLLDSEMNGRLGDFGLAKMYERGSNPSATKVVGTLGYLAPELTKTGKPTVRSDVFAFGALLLEVVCGRRPVETKAVLEELVLVDWVWEKWREGCVLKVVDPRLNGVYDEIEVEVVIKLGLLCSDNDPCRRPSMRQVVSVLEGELTLPENIVCSDEGDGEKIGSCYKVSMWSSASDGVDLETGSMSPISGVELR